MKAILFLLIAIIFVPFLSVRQTPNSTKKEIYRSGWIDLNKNGRMDIYEHPKMQIEDHVTDLVTKMTLEEKTCQTATLYGYNRVLKDELPTPNWKNEIWKDGIANIDEHLNGWDKGSKSIYATDLEKHVW